MMSWLSLAIAFLSVARSIFEYLDKRNAEDSVKARVYLAAMKDIDERLAHAKAAADSVRADFDAGRVPVDGYRD